MKLVDQGRNRQEPFARQQRPSDEIPPRVEYELTDGDRELAERLQPLVERVEESQ